MLVEQNNLKKFLIKIWPTVYKMINATPYFIISL